MTLTTPLQHLIGMLALSGSVAVCAQSVNVTAPELGDIQTQRAVIEQEKKQVLDQFQSTSKACWQKFAVNDCLAFARRQKYQALAPLDQREIQLNAKERELKELDRQQRLSDKAISKGAN
ncbi:MAG: hypothetical protein KGN99_04530 [Pseudomonadota bacterium]|nr:hypothetical protein [Pseudomonadota bacterium]